MQFIRAFRLTIAFAAISTSLAAQDLPITFVQSGHISGDQAQFAADLSGIDHNGVFNQRNGATTWTQEEKLHWTRLLSETWDGGEVTVTNLDTAAALLDIRGLSDAFRMVSNERGRPYYGYFNISRLPGFFFREDIDSQPNSYRSRALRSDGLLATRYPEHQWTSSSLIGFTGNDLDVTNAAAVQAVLSELGNVFRSNCTTTSTCTGPLFGYVFLNEMKLSRHWSPALDDPERESLAPSNPAYQTCDFKSTANPAAVGVIPRTSCETIACRKANFLPWQAGHFQNLRGDSDPKWAFLNPPKRAIPLFSQSARNHFIDYAASVGATSVVQANKLPADRDEFNLACSEIDAAPALPHPGCCTTDMISDCEPWPPTKPSTWLATCTDPSLDDHIGFFPPGHEIWPVWEDWVFDTWTGFLRDVSDTIYQAQCGTGTTCSNPDFQGIMYFRAPESYAIRTAAEEPLTYQYFDSDGALQTETIVLADQPHFATYNSPVYGVDLELLFDSPAVTGVIHETSSAIHHSGFGNSLSGLEGTARDEKLIFPDPGRPEYFKHYHLAKGFLAKRVAHQRGKLFGAFARAHHFGAGPIAPEAYSDAWDRTIQILQPDVISTISPHTYLSAADGRGVYDSLLTGFSGQLRAEWLPKLAAIADPTAGTRVLVDRSQTSFVRADGAGTASLSPLSAVAQPQTLYGAPDGIDHFWNAEDNMQNGAFLGWGAISSHKTFENSPPFTVDLFSLPSGIDFDVYGRYIIDTFGTPGNTSFGLSLGTTSNSLTAYAENYPGHRVLRQQGGRTEVETYLGRATSSGGSVSIFVDDDNIDTLAIWTGARFVNSAGGAVPVADFTHNCNELTCTFDGSISSDDLGIGTYSWDFGDGSVLAVGAVTSHTFAATGTYAVTLTVRDTAGQVGGRTRSVSVSTGPSLPGKAHSENPTNHATGISTTPTLTWTVGQGATSQEVYFGSCPNPPFATPLLTQTSHPAGWLSSGTEYCWRIDSVNSAGTTLGDLWRFTTAVPLTVRPACDFNGDGRSDLAIGVPGETIGSLAGGGAVTVLYSDSTGPTGAGSEEWHQNVTGIGGAAESVDAFGSSVACGDFNGDGFDDLAVGSPGEWIGSITDAGAVNVIYGTAGGLSAANDQLWYQSLSSLLDTSETADAFAAALATGDFDGDGFDDLAVGIPGETLGGEAGAGAVQVLYGTALGISANHNQIWHQDRPTILDVAEAGDRFGATLAAGDFDGDGLFDLAIGAPGESVGSSASAGQVHVLYGAGSTGLAKIRNQLWNQNSAGIAGGAESNDAFGTALTAGDFNGDGRDDLVIGVPGEDLGTLVAAGVIHTLNGDISGLTAADSKIWSQNASQITGGAESGDEFGASVASGDFNNDGRDDVAIGSPGEAIGSVAEAGAIHVMLGGVNGLTGANSKIWTQNGAGILDQSEPDDRFGSTVSIGDFNGDGYDDLAIGVPFESVGTVNEAGAVNILFGGSSGPTATGDQFWHQNSTGVIGTAESSDFFGAALARDTP